MHIPSDTLLTAIILGSFTSAVGIAVPSHGGKFSVIKRQADFIPESEVDGQATGKLRSCKEPSPVYKDQDAATWWERNDAKTALENTRTSKRGEEPELPKHSDQGDGFNVDHILELQVIVQAFDDDNKQLNDKSKAISSGAWTKAQKAVNGDDVDGCKKVAEQVTVLDNLLGITKNVNLGKTAAVTKILSRKSDRQYKAKWGDYIGAILDELDNHAPNLDTVITNIGNALKDITGEDAVATYINDFCTNNMQAVQAFLRDLQKPEPSNSTATINPNAIPTPPVGHAIPAQVNPRCDYDPAAQYSVQDLKAVQDILTDRGYGSNNDNCCNTDQGGCNTLASSGGVAVQMCGGTPNSCAACTNIAIALNVLNIDCSKDYKIGGTEGIPYLDGVVLELVPPDHPQKLRNSLQDRSATNSSAPDPNQAPLPVGTEIPAEVSPSCNYNPADQYNVHDLKLVQDDLTSRGYGSKNNNCCTGDPGGCNQLGFSGGVAVQMCGTPYTFRQCAACANIAIALNVLNIDCSKDYKIGGTEGIPYLDGVTLELTPPEPPPSEADT